MINLGPVPDFLVIDAVRYALGRASAQVAETAGWLTANWGRLPFRVRRVVRRDVEREFERDDEARPQGHEHKPLGWDCDRAEWEKVRKLWERSEEWDTGN